MRYRPIQAALRERVPITLCGRSKVRTVLAAVAASAAALVPTVMVASPALAATADNLTITSGADWEGADVTFKLTYSGTSAATFTLSATDNSGSANAAATGGADLTASDYVKTAFTVNGAAAQTTVVFPASNASSPSTATVAVTTGLDADMADEEFKLIATNTAIGGGAGDNSVKSVYGTIWAYTSNAYPTFKLKGPSAAVPETATTNAAGATVQKTVTVTATLTDVLSHPVTIPVSTIPGSALSSGGEFRDFTALPAGTVITIPAYSYTGTVDVELYDDSLDETATQNFSVASGTTYGPQPFGGSQSVLIGIADNEATPTVSIASAPAAAEGDYLSFPVSLSGLSELSVTTKVSTADGITRQDSNAATSGDYTAKADELVTISPYTRSRTVSVETTDDGDFEGPENLKVVLSDDPADTTYATLGTPTTASGVINDNDDGPDVALSTADDPANNASSHSGSSFKELASGENVRKIKVTVPDSAPSGPWPIPIKIDYAFKDGTATNGVDYKGTAGSFTIPPGTAGLTAEIPVTIIGDTVKEGGPGFPAWETFDVVLSSSNGTIDPASTGGTIYITEDSNDDVTPTWAVGNASVTEGNTGTVTAKVPVTLSAPAAQDTVFSIGLADGTATETGVNSGVTVGANDYDWPTNRTLTIPAGSTTGNIEVPINSDSVYEQDETVVVTPTLTSANINPTAATGTLHSAALSIINDDAKPSITFNNLTGNEGGLLRVNGTVNGLSQYNYKVGFAIAGGTSDPATAGTDFDAPATIATSTLTITRGTTGALLSPFPFDVYLTPDSIDEATESFTVTATEVTPAPTGFTTSVGTYKITDDPADVPPAVSIRNETIGEYEGSVDVHVDRVFTGDTTSTTQPESVSYWTENGAAKAGEDYTSMKGTLTFAPGEMTKTINVPITNDTTKEGAENFYVKLGTPSPTGASIAKGTGEVTIKANDGGTPQPGNGGPTITVPATVTGAVAVPISGKADPGATVELWAAPMAAKQADLMKITEVTAGDDGSYKFSRWIGQGTRFQTKVGDKTSDEMSVKVMQAPAFTATSPSKGVVNLAVQGNPRAPGQTVIVQRFANGAWVNTTWRGATGSNNSWKATVKVASHSSWTLRAFVAGYTPTGILPGYSVAKKLTVK